MLRYLHISIQNLWQVWRDYCFSTIIRVSVSSAGAISFKLNNLRYNGHRRLILAPDSCNFSCIVILFDSRMCMARLYCEFGHEKMEHLSGDHHVFENNPLDLTVFCFLWSCCIQKYLPMLAEPLFLEVSICFFS